MAGQLGLICSPRAIRFSIVQVRLCLFIAQSPAQFSRRASAAVGPDGKVYGHVLVHPHVYANHAVGLVVAAREEWLEADSGLSSNQWRAIAYPGGVNNAVVEDRSGANAVTSLGGLRYASWCPLTGELARDRTTAVCFV